MNMQAAGGIFKEVQREFSPRGKSRAA